MPNKTIGLERDLYKKLKREIKTISWIRLENRVLLGTPDLLAYSSNGNFFTLELKRTKSSKVQLSPHQVSFHAKHTKNTYVLVACDPKLGNYRLYPGSGILALENFGLKLEPLACGWSACRLLLESL